MTGMSVWSVRKWQCGPLPSQTRQDLRWRTPPDSFQGVWEEEIETLLLGAQPVLCTVAVNAYRELRPAWLHSKHRSNSARFMFPQAQTLLEHLRHLAYSAFLDRPQAHVVRSFRCRWQSPPNSGAGSLHGCSLHRNLLAITNSFRLV